VVSVSVPVAVGLSLSDFYTDANDDNASFGFFSVGVALGIPINDYFGFSAGVSFLSFGDALKAELKVDHRVRRSEGIGQ
jgi:hypothetical protein